MPFECLLTLSELPHPVYLLLSAMQKVYKTTLSTKRDRDMWKAQGLHVYFRAHKVMAQLTQYFQLSK